MNFDNILGSLEKNSTMLGGAIGFFGNGLDNCMAILTRASQGQIQMPDISHAINWAMNDGTLKTAFTAFIVGWAAKEFDVPVLGKHGTAIENLAVGYAGGAILYRIAWLATGGT